MHAPEEYRRLRSYEGGFLLSEVLLADGSLDLSRAVAMIREHRPNIRFSLEMMTRDPLKVPCLSDNYWITFPDRNGLYLARTVRFVNEHRSPQPFCPASRSFRTKKQ